jgi:hypothetical protein
LTDDDDDDDGGIVCRVIFGVQQVEVDKKPENKAGTMYERT